MSVSDPSPAQPTEGVHEHSASALSPHASRSFTSPGRVSVNPTIASLGPGRGASSGGSSMGSALLAEEGRAAAFAQLKDALIAVTDEAESLRTAVVRYEESSKARAGLDEQVRSTLLHSEERIAELQKELQQERAALQKAKEDVRRAKGELLSGEQRVRAAGNEASIVLRAQVDSLQYQVQQLEQEKQRLEGVVARGRSSALANAVRSSHPGAYFEPVQAEPSSAESTDVLVSGQSPSGKGAGVREGEGLTMTVTTSPPSGLAPPTSPTPSSSPSQAGTSPEERQAGEGADRPPLSQRKSGRSGAGVGQAPGILTAMLLPGMTAVRRGSFSSMGVPTPKARAGSMSGSLSLRAASPLPPSAAESRRGSVSAQGQGQVGRALGIGMSVSPSLVLAAPQPDPAILQAAVSKAIRDTLFAVFGTEVPTIEEAKVHLQGLINERVQAGEGPSATRVVVQSHAIDQLKRELREMTAQFQMSQDDARRALAERLAMAIHLQAAQDRMTALQRQLDEAEAGAAVAALHKHSDGQLSSSAGGGSSSSGGGTVDDKRVQALQDRMASLMASETAARAQVKELKQQVETLMGENHKLVDEGKRAGTQAEHEAALSSLAEQLRTTRAQLEQVQSEADNVKAALENERAVLAAVQKEADAWKAEQQDLQAQVRGLEQGVVQGDREIKSLRAERDRVKASLQQAEEALARAVDKGRQDVEDALEQGRAKERELVAEIDGERASRRALEQRTEELATILSQERTELHSALQQLQLAQASEQYMAGKLKEAQEDVSHGDQNLAKLQKQLNEAQRSIASLQMFVDGRSAEATAARAAGNAVGTTGGLAGSNVLQRTAMLEAEMRAAKEAAASARSELSTERARTTSLQAQLAALQAELQVQKSPASSPHRRALATSAASRAIFPAPAFSPGAPSTSHSPERKGLSAVMVASTYREDELLATVSSLTAQVEQLKADAEQGEHGLQRELSSARTSLLAAERARDLLQVDLDRVRSQQAVQGEAVQGEVSRMSSMLEQVHRQRDELVAKVAAQSATIDSLRAGLHSAEGQVQRLSAQLEASNRDLAKAARDLEAYQRAMVDSHYTKQHRTAAERRVSELEAELRSAKTDIVAAQQKVRDLSLAADVTRAEVASSQAKVARMQQEMTVAQAESASARREVASAQSSIAGLRETKQLLESKVRSLENDLYSPRR